MQDRLVDFQLTHTQLTDIYMQPSRLAPPSD